MFFFFARSARNWWCKHLQKDKGDPIRQTRGLGREWKKKPFSSSSSSRARDYKKKDEQHLVSPISLGGGGTLDKCRSWFSGLKGGGLKSCLSLSLFFKEDVMT